MCCKIVIHQLIIEDLFSNICPSLYNFQISLRRNLSNPLNWERKQSQTMAADSGWLHQRPPQTIQYQYCITMVGLTNHNNAHILLQLDITDFIQHFIWLYQDSKELRQRLSAQKSNMHILKNKLIFHGFRFKVSDIRVHIRGLLYTRINVLSSGIEPSRLLLPS